MSKIYCYSHDEVVALQLFTHIPMVLGIILFTAQFMYVEACFVFVAMVVSLFAHSLCEPWLNWVDRVVGGFLGIWMLVLNVRLLKLGCGNFWALVSALCLGTLGMAAFWIDKWGCHNGYHAVWHILAACGFILLALGHSGAKTFSLSCAFL